MFFDFRWWITIGAKIRFIFVLFFMFHVILKMNYKNQRVFNHFSCQYWFVKEKVSGNHLSGKGVRSLYFEDCLKFEVFHVLRTSSIIFTLSFNEIEKKRKKQHSQSLISFWIHGFRDSIPVRKLRACCYDIKKFRAKQAALIVKFKIKAV